MQRSRATCAVVKEAMLAIAHGEEKKGEGEEDKREEEKKRKNEITLHEVGEAEKSPGLLPVNSLCA